MSLEAQLEFTNKVNLLLYLVPVIVFVASWRRWGMGLLIHVLEFLFPGTDFRGAGAILKVPWHAVFGCFYIGLSGPLILYLKSLSRNSPLVHN